MKDDSSHHAELATRPIRPPEPFWENFPTKLISRFQWVCWLYLLVAGRWTKVPCEPDGKKASVIDPTTWASLECVQCAYYSPRDGKVPFDGVGFVITGADPFTVFDFDKCRNPETGEIEARIANYVNKLDSYSEISPSGTGIRVVVEAKLPGQHRRAGHIEMYDDVRFVSITGHVL